MLLALSLYTPVYLEDFAFNKDYYLSKNKDACLKMEIIPKLQLKKGRRSEHIKFNQAFTVEKTMQK